MTRTRVRYVVVVALLETGLGACGRRGDSVPDPSGIAAATLIEHLQYRVTTGRNTFDPAMRELLKVVCRASPETSTRIDSAKIEELFPLDRLKEAESVGCGFLVSKGRSEYGRAFGSGSNQAKSTP